MKDEENSANTSTDNTFANNSNVTNEKSASADSILVTFTKHKLALKKFISGFLVKKEDIEDIAQESFLRSYTAEKSQTILYPKAFIFKVAKNLMLSEFDRKSFKVTDFLDDLDSKQKDSIAAQEDVEGNVIAQQQVANYCKAIASLPPQCRKVMLLKKVYGLKNREIAKRLGVSISCVEKHLKKGLVDTTLYMQTPIQLDAKNSVKTLDPQSYIMK